MACRYVPLFDPNLEGPLSAETLSAARSQATSMIRNADPNNDGLISRAEFRAILTDAPEMDALANYDMRLMPAFDEDLHPVP